MTSRSASLAAMGRPPVASGGAGSALHAGAALALPSRRAFTLFPESHHHIP